MVISSKVGEVDVGGGSSARCAYAKGGLRGRVCRTLPGLGRDLRLLEEEGEGSGMGVSCGSAIVVVGVAFDIEVISMVRLLGFGSQLCSRNSLYRFPIPRSQGV